MSGPPSPQAQLVAALVPTLVLVAVLGSDMSGEEVTPARVLELAGLFGVLVYGPCAFATLAPWRWWLLEVTTVVLIAVCGYAGRAVVTTDDAQAGLAILLVPVVALPLGAALWLARIVRELRRSAAEQP